jgi:peptide deformylase
MAVRDILEYPDPRLNAPSVPVETFDARIERIAADLVDTLHASRSIGLSAPQIDVREQILVMDHSGDQSAAEVFINPEILGQRRYGLVEERCLSVPGLVTNVLRATEIRIRAFDLSGVSFERELIGMPAVCLQHEMDHFAGKLLADRINWFRRRRLRAALEKSRQAA